MGDNLAIEGTVGDAMDKFGKKHDPIKTVKSGKPL